MILSLRGSAPSAGQSGPIGSRSSMVSVGIGVSGDGGGMMPRAMSMTRAARSLTLEAPCCLSVVCGTPGPERNDRGLRLLDRTRRARLAGGGASSGGPAPTELQLSPTQSNPSPNPDHRWGPLSCAALCGRLRRVMGAAISLVWRAKSWPAL